MAQTEQGALGAGRAGVRSYFGRELELDELGRALADALAGRGRLVLLSGEPGIGKTRLCDELSAHARAAGVEVVWGRCWEAGGAPAYFPWLEPLAAISAGLDAEQLATKLGDGAAALFALVPGLGSRAALPVSGGADSPEQARIRLFMAITTLLGHAAAPRGLVLVLDDLHAADEPSLLLLCFVARELRRMRVLVLGTFRDVEARLTSEVEQALARVAREGTLRALARLGPEPSAHLLRARVGEVDSGVQAEVFRRTQGNPLFLEHMAQLLRSGEDAAHGALPMAVRELIRGRLGRVSAPTRAILEAGAVSGDEFEPERVAEALGQPVERVRAAFAEAVRAGLLLERERGRLRFAHALVREVLEHDLPAERSRELHGAIVAALQQRLQDRAEAAYAELAHHGLQGPARGLEQAARHAVLAARRALAVFAFEEAVALLERARAALEAEHGRSALFCDVLTALGEALIRRGEGARGKAACLRAIELARALDDPERIALGALAYGLELTAALVHADLVALLQEALAALPVADTRLRVHVTARLAAAMQPHHDLAIPIALANEAIASARRIGEPSTLLDALYAGMAAMMDIVDPRERVPLNLEIEQLASSAGDYEKVLRTHARLAFDHMELGDLASADARIDAFERVARQTDAHRYLWRVPLFRSMRALVHGRFSQAQELIAEARLLATHAGDPQSERCLVFHHEGLLRAAERHEELVAFDPETRRMRAALYSGPHWQNGGSAFTCARLEDLDDARMYLRLVPEDDWPLVQNAPAFMYLGEPLALVGERAAVQTMYAQLLPASHRSISWGWTKFIWDGPASRLLGLLAARLEQWDDAERHFAQALADLTRLDALPYLARTRYEHARVLLLRGRAQDVERARAGLHEACALAERLGMSGLVRLAEGRLGSLTGHADATAPGDPWRAPSEARLPMPLALTFVQEGEYWSVAYAGDTFRLRDSLGLQYLARLLAEPGRELHVLTLSGAQSGAPDEVTDHGDAGELLDEQARLRYRARLVELREAEREAESFGDAARAERAREELEFLTAELARAVGLGGRVRRAGSASERARSAVQRRIRNAVERVRERSPALGALLDRSVRTGTRCVYLPGHDAG